MATPFDRRFTPAREDLAAERLRGAISAPRYVAPRVLRVTVEALPLSREPRRDVSIDTQALFGESVDIYDIDAEGWAWGQLQRDGYVGYMPAEGLREDAPSPTHGVVAPRTFAYPGPDMKLPPLMALPMGAQIAATGVRGSFLAVAGAGFVWSAHTATPDHLESDFVGVAERFLCVPYLWGGKTFSGIDCSGLMQVSLAAAGVAAPRDTDVMERGVGAPVVLGESLDGLRRGDLVFWKGHVGVMRDGRDLLHANGHAMMVTSEPLAIARERIRAATGGDITSVRRI